MYPFLENSTTATAIFKNFDIDGNGTVTTEELVKMMAESAGERVPQFEVEVMAAMVDKNGDGKINFEEFLQMMINGYLFSVISIICV